MAKASGGQRGGRVRAARTGDIRRMTSPTVAERSIRSVPRVAMTQQYAWNAGASRSLAVENQAHLRIRTSRVDSVLMLHRVASRFPCSRRPLSVRF
jgi:hypothetical protein